MFNRRSIYLFLGSATLCSLFFNGLFIYVFAISILIILFMNRGLIYTLRANKELMNKNEQRGYELLTKAYKAGGIPVIVINGYIFISLKMGKYDIALDAINRVLNNELGFKIKDTHKNMILTQKALYLWQIGDLPGGVDILDELYKKEYRTSIFYGNYGTLLYLNGQIEKAKKIGLEGYDYDPKDKVTLDNLVSIFIELKDFDLAEKYFNELLELNPTFAEAFYHGALIKLNQNSFDEAINLYQRCKEYTLHNVSTISNDDLETLEKKLSVK
ncbi:tetratricopeptide repeat protein [Thiospirochaeta perfilievii]|uniref:Tetratricopeptide repeat protein n=1 Tax=Thiospirochaeta perfilievii TaxID=252967 RepID=A0A5C1Q7V8_9SPIO|nr:tetratricopeptide repeat protein [Thiospirochaeta perfilievii]QEN04163.1 tetratricopeptide repeat protein [Thiospirochaeta perfilievii]